MDSNADARLVDRLSQSQIFRDYEDAFGKATRLPLSIQTVDMRGVPHEGKKFQNRFCTLLAKSNQSCVACLEVQEELSRNPEAGGSRTISCFAGLSDTAVPLEVGNRVVGFLQSGQVALEKPTRVRFRRIVKQLVEWGAKVDLRELEEAYFHTRVITPEQYQAMIRLLEIFALHLTAISNQMAVQEAHSEQPFLQQAREYIDRHQADPITLEQIARALNISTFYFCKRFKKATGLNFTEYLARVRVEKAKNLLLNPHLRVSEIAFEVGFQSLTHFNRVFNRIVGCSPTAYRESLPV